MELPLDIWQYEILKHLNDMDNQLLLLTNKFFNFIPLKSIDLLQMYLFLLEPDIEKRKMMQLCTVLCNPESIVQKIICIDDKSNTIYDFLRSRPGSNSFGSKDISSFKFNYNIFYNYYIQLNNNKKGLLFVTDKISIKYLSQLTVSEKNDNNWMTTNKKGRVGNPLIKTLSQLRRKIIVTKANIDFNPEYIYNQNKICFIDISQEAATHLEPYKWIFNRKNIEKNIEKNKLNFNRYLIKNFILELRINL